MPKLKPQMSKKIHPGVSSFADKPENIGDDHLKQLMKAALDEVPKDKVAETPVFLMATAGMRLLPSNKQTELLHSICSYLQHNTKFRLPDCDAHIQIISGETEGLYGWIAANYLLGGFDEPEKHNHGQDHHTYGFLDMGGASAQIAFAPNSTESDRHADDLKLVRLRRLDGSPLEYKVFTSTWLGYGANQARNRYIDKLREQYNDSDPEIPDPCLPKGLKVTPDERPPLVGTGDFKECISKTFPLLGKNMPCADSPCLLNGQHAPAIDFDINHFVGVSEYWHTTHGVFGKEEQAYDLAAYQSKVQEFCTREWSSIESDLTKRKKTPEEKVQEAKEACFKASWLINMLHDGIGIPRIAGEHVPDPGLNVPPDVLEEAKKKGLLNPFQPIDKVDENEVSWTLGKMVLYASGQVPPNGTRALPVGFGSNVGTGTPHDFEHAGSTPLTHLHDDDDDDIRLPKGKGSYFGLLVFVLLIAAVAYWLRKPERRRKLFASVKRHRKGGVGRRDVRSLALFNRILGRNSQTYERVLEEGDAPEFELGGLDSDESDSTDGMGSSKRPGITTPRLGFAGFGSSEDLPAPPSMDRRGLAVRTESREHLAAPSVQMLNAGRRSRTGSPTRRISPLATVM